MAKQLNAEIERAIALKDSGKAQKDLGQLDEAIVLLKRALQESTDMETRVGVALEVVNCILEQRGINEGVGLPDYGTSEFEELYEHLRMSMTLYKQLDSSAQAAFDIGGCKGLLKIASLENPEIKKLEQALNALPSEFPSGRIIVARRSKWADDFLSQFPHEKTHSFSNDDASILGVARQVANNHHLLILMNTDGCENELLTDKRNRGAASKTPAKQGCFIATAVYGSPLAPEVKTFQRFRDEVLLSSTMTALLVEIYYVLSPALASRIRRAEYLKRATRKYLLVPMLRLIHLKMSKLDKASEMERMKVGHVTSGQGSSIAVHWDPHTKEVYLK